MRALELLYSCTYSRDCFFSLYLISEFALTCSCPASTSGEVLEGTVSWQSASLLMVKFLDTENDKVEEDGGISMLPETFSTLLHALSKFAG